MVDDVSGAWDESLKKLVQTAPQDFDSLLLPGAVWAQELSTELVSRDILADALHKVYLNGKEVLLHLEFQKRGDSEMAQRLLEYNSMVARKYKLPVWSTVIYLSKTSVVKAPLVYTRPDGHEILRFDFQVIKLWELSVDDILKTRHAGLYPLLPLARDGKRPEVVEQMLTELVTLDHRDLLSFAYLFSSLTFAKGEEQSWLKRRFAMFESILEESWAYKEMKQKAEKQGKEEGEKRGKEEAEKKAEEKAEEKWRQKSLQEAQEGRQKGLQEGLQEGMIQSLLTIVEARFPALLPQAKALLEHTRDPQTLQRLLLALTLAQNAEEASHSLSNGNSR